MSGVSYLGFSVTSNVFATLKFHCVRVRVGGFLFLTLWVSVEQAVSVRRQLLTASAGLT